MSEFLKNLVLWLGKHQFSLVSFPGVTLLLVFNAPLNYYVDMDINSEFSDSEISCPFIKREEFLEKKYIFRTFKIKMGNFVFYKFFLVLFIMAYLYPFVFT